MAQYEIVTWDSTNKLNKRRISSDEVFDFGGIRLGADLIAISPTTVGGNPALDVGGVELTNMAVGTQTNSAVTKQQMEDAISTAIGTGGIVKEAILSTTQLDVTGIGSAGLFFLTGVAANGDTFVITNGVDTETYTFTNSTPGPFTPAVGSSAAQSMQNLADNIANNSSVWYSEFYPDELDSVNPGGVVFVTTIASTTETVGSSRFYGVFATQSNAFIQRYDSEIEYKTTATIQNLESTDPGSGRFGFGRAAADLINGELHFAHAQNYIEAWDNDATNWVTFSNIGSIPKGEDGPGGAEFGIVTGDSDQGMSVNAGVMAVKLNGLGLQFVSGDIAIILDGGTLEQSGAGLKVAPNGITATEINPGMFDGTIAGGNGSPIGLVANAVSETYLTTSVAGDGLTGGGGDPLSVVVGDGLQLAGDTVLADYTESLINDNAGSITVRKVVYLKSNGHVDLAVASGISGLNLDKIGVVADATIATTATGKIYLRQGARITGFSGLTPGKVYIDRATPGSVTQDLSGFVSGEQVYRVGWAINATTILFDPEHEIEL